MRPDARGVEGAGRERQRGLARAAAAAAWPRCVAAAARAAAVARAERRRRRSGGAGGSGVARAVAVVVAAAAGGGSGGVAARAVLSECKTNADCMLYAGAGSGCCGVCQPASDPAPPPVECLLACLTPLKTCGCVNNQCVGSKTQL